MYVLSWNSENNSGLVLVHPKQNLDYFDSRFCLRKNLEEQCKMMRTRLIQVVLVLVSSSFIFPVYQPDFPYLPFVAIVPEFKCSIPLQFLSFSYHMPAQSICPPHLSSLQQPHICLSPQSSFLFAVTVGLEFSSSQQFACPQIRKNSSWQPGKFTNSRSITVYYIDLYILYYTVFIDFGQPF